MSTGTTHQAGGIAPRPRHPRDQHDGGVWSLPKTLLGSWSVALAAVFFIFMMVFFALVASGLRGGDTFFSEWRLTIPFVAAAICGIGAAGTGLFALFRKRERSLLVILATLLGLFVVYFISGEILFPH